MKVCSKLFISAVGFFFLGAAIKPSLLGAQSLSITNIFGGNEDKLEGSDFFRAEGFSANDRVQVDFSSEKVESRVRLDIYDAETDGDNSKFRFRGYGKYTPVNWLSLVAGNSFFTKFGHKGAELFALDDTPTYGRIIKSGLALYSEVPLEETLKLKLGAGLESKSTFTSDDTNAVLDFGAEIVKKGKISFGVQARDPLAGLLAHYSAFLGFYVSDFRLNTAFTYNNTDNDIIKDDAKYTLSASLLYKNKEKPFSAAVDILSALNSEYLDSDSKETLSYENSAIPFMTAFRAEYEFSKQMSAGFFAKWQDLLGQNGNTKFSFYPSFKYKNKKEFCQFEGGVRLTFNNIKSAGEHFDYDITIPLLFTLKYDLISSK